MASSLSSMRTGSRPVRIWSARAAAGDRLRGSRHSRRSAWHSDRHRQHRPGGSAEGRRDLPGLRVARTGFVQRGASTMTLPFDRQIRKECAPQEDRACSRGGRCLCHLFRKGSVGRVRMAFGPNGSGWAEQARPRAIINSSSLSGCRANTDWPPPSTISPGATVRAAEQSMQSVSTYHSPGAFSTWRSLVIAEPDFQPQSNDCRNAGRSYRWCCRSRPPRLVRCAARPFELDQESTPVPPAAFRCVGSPGSIVITARWLQAGVVVEPL